MRYVLALIATLGLSASNAGSQALPNSPLLLAQPFASPFIVTNSPTAGDSHSLPSLYPENPASAKNGDMALNASTGSPASTGSADPEPQYVQGVYQKYAWQAYVGYTFFRFYESSHPTLRENQNGVNWSIVRYWKDWLGLDGEMSATYGTQGGQDSWFLFGGGGPRFRWSGPRGLELWGHALFGGTHFTPQTAFGPQEAFAYEVGGGVDIGGHYKRWAVRLSGDMIGSHYFSTYQFSPKFSAGFVFKF